MSIGRLNSRITRLAVGRHLPRRTVRVRLTLLYGGLFVVSGAALMAIAYALLVNAGFVFSLQNGTGSQPAQGQAVGLFSQGSSAGFPAPGSRTYPSAPTMAHWRGVAQCMRGHGVSAFPDPVAKIPSKLGGMGSLNARDGAIFVIPATLDTQSQAFTHATTACGYMADYTEGTAVADRQRNQTRQELLVQSGIALAGMSLLSLGLGWLMAGRVLQPLEDSYHAQRQFVANASHELRAPLTRLRALSETAIASPSANAESLRRAHERVLASEQDLEQLIDALLALTRGQAGLEWRERLDLATLASEAMLAHEPQLAGLDLDVRATLDPAHISGDPRLLGQMIANLIDNAIRHNIPGGRLEITTGTRDRHAFLTIANTGPTVPADQVERLFEPFQRLEGARTRHKDGHGLGLSIVQAIANAHHAELDARPQPEGGLNIELSFPPAGGPRASVTPATTRTTAARASIVIGDGKTRGHS